MRDAEGGVGVVHRAGGERNGIAVQIRVIRHGHLAGPVDLQQRDGLPRGFRAVGPGPQAGGGASSRRKGPVVIREPRGSSEQYWEGRCPESRQYCACTVSSWKKGS